MTSPLSITVRTPFGRPRPEAAVAARRACRTMVLAHRGALAAGFERIEGPTGTSRDEETVALHIAGGGRIDLVTTLRGNAGQASLVAGRRPRARLECDLHDLPPPVVEALRAADPLDAVASLVAAFATAAEAPFDPSPRMPAEPALLAAVLAGIGEEKDGVRLAYRAATPLSGADLHDLNEGRHVPVPDGPAVLVVAEWGVRTRGPEGAVVSTALASLSALRTHLTTLDGFDVVAAMRYAATKARTDA